MITYSLLGYYGRLGNQLFQIAACLGLAARVGTEVLIPRWSDGDILAEPPKLQTPGPIDLSGARVYHEEGFAYQELPLEERVDLRGFFQSYRYFEHIEDEIRRRFRLRAQKGLCGGLAAVHVRRGDYVGNAAHPLPSLEYYRLAISELRQEGVRRFRVFSDDLAWCHEHLADAGVEFGPEQAATQDLAEMVDCEHFIIANSTFSWWAAWLGASPAKRVIYPPRWFGGPYRNWDTRDLCPPSWEKSLVL